MLELKLLRERFAGRVRGFGFSGHHLGISVDICRVRAGRHVERAPLHQGPDLEGHRPRRVLRTGRPLEAVPRPQGRVAVHVVQEDGHPALGSGAARQAQVGLLQPGRLAKKTAVWVPFFCANDLSPVLTTGLSVRSVTVPTSRCLRERESAWLASWGRAHRPLCRAVTTNERTSRHTGCRCVLLRCSRGF